MTEAAPAPLTPPGCNLRDFAFMPLEVARLRRSKAWLICKRRPELAFYLLNLWTAAWHEVPAGSLEDDPDVLADLAMCPPNDWDRVADDVLRGWVKCSDGRLYHPVVAEKVNDAWNQKLEHAYDRECERLRKAFKRAGITPKEIILPSFDEWVVVEMSGGKYKVSDGQLRTTHINTSLSAGNNIESVRTSQKRPPENALKGEVRESKGRSKGDIHTDDTCPADDCPQDIPSEKGRDPEPPSLPPVLQAQLEDDKAQFKRLVELMPQTAHFVDLITWEHNCYVLRDKHGQTWDDLHAIAERYAAWVNAGGVSGPQYVIAGHKFFAPTLDFWRRQWTPPPSKAETRLAKNLAAAEQARMELEAEERAARAAAGGAL